MPQFFVNHVCYTLFNLSVFVMHIMSPSDYKFIGSFPYLLCIYHKYLKCYLPLKCLLMPKHYIPLVRYERRTLSEISSKRMA